MMKKFILTFACAALSQTGVWAGPAAAKPEVVAEGFTSWTIPLKGFVQGRQIQSSDLRQRVVAIVCLKPDNTIQRQLINMAETFRGLDEMPASFDAQWDTMETMPRRCVIVVNFTESTKTIAEDLKNALKSSKDMKEEDSKELVTWTSNIAPAFYAGITFAGQEAVTETPYVYIFDGKAAEPVYKGVWKKSEQKKIRETIYKAKNDLPEWKDLTGVTEVVHHKDIEKKILSGKPLKPVLAALKNRLADKDPEKAKEAQIMYDAIVQFKSDLKLRILTEFRGAPARGFVDAQRLFKYFPEEKKSVAQVELYFKSNKSILSLGKMFEKYVEWMSPDFTFKNASEAKKAAQLITTWKKPLEKMAEDSSNTILQGEAALILGQVEGLADVLMTKVPQK